MSLMPLGSRWLEPELRRVHAVVSAAAAPKDTRSRGKPLPRRHQARAGPALSGIRAKLPGELPGIPQHLQAARTAKSRRGCASFRLSPTRPARRRGHAGAHHLTGPCCARRGGLPRMLHLLHGLFQVVVLFPRLSPAQREKRVQTWAQGMLERLGVELEVHGTPASPDRSFWSRTTFPGSTSSCCMPRATAASSPRPTYGTGRSSARSLRAPAPSMSSANHAATRCG